MAPAGVEADGDEDGGRGNRHYDFCGAGADDGGAGQREGGRWLPGVGRGRDRGHNLSGAAGVGPGGGGFFADSVEEPPAEFVAGPLQAFCGGLARDTEKAGDFADLYGLEVVENEDFTVGFVEIGELIPDHPSEFVARSFR